jgi:hypothetical protein
MDVAAAAAAQPRTRRALRSSIFSAFKSAHAVP